MALGEQLNKLLEKIYPPNQRIDDEFKGKAITFITNELGEPITLFIGKRNANGTIDGERYVRRIVRSHDGTSIIKSHWDLKGKVKGGWL